MATVVNLCVLSSQLAPLIEAVHARAVVVSNDSNSTPEEKAALTDLEERIELLYDAIAAEGVAKAAREAYNRRVQYAQYDDNAAVEAVIEPVESKQEPRSTATVAKRPA